MVRCKLAGGSWKISLDLDLFLTLGHAFRVFNFSTVLQVSSRLPLEVAVAKVAARDC